MIYYPHGSCRLFRRSLRANRRFAAPSVCFDTRFDTRAASFGNTGEQIRSSRRTIDPSPREVRASVVSVTLNVYRSKVEVEKLGSGA